MAKKIRIVLTLQLPAGKATPAPPVGTALGPHGINIVEFTKAYNEKTADKAGQVIPAQITIFEDRSFTFVLKTPPAPDLLRKAAGIDKGSQTPKRETVGRVTRDQVRQIAEIKLPDLNVERHRGRHEGHRGHRPQHGHRGRRLASPRRAAGSPRPRRDSRGRSARTGRSTRPWPSTASATRTPRSSSTAPGSIQSTRRSRSRRRPPASSSTPRSRPTFASASTPATPTRWSAGPSCCPHGTGKVVRVAVFAQGEKAQEASAPAPTRSAAEDLVKKIEAGWLEFDVAIATPDTMGQVGRLGRILGRRGLMPNPKAGTVTFDIERAVKEVKGGRVEFKVDKGAIVHVPVGKASFEADAAGRRTSRRSWTRSTAPSRAARRASTSGR